MILAAGLTPAWQQILTFNNFTLGEVNRAHTAHWCASGKVLNVGIALHHLANASRTLAVIGGRAGDEIRHEFAEQGIAARWIESSEPTRICTTILDSHTGTTTELVENAHPLPPELCQAFLDVYAEEAAAAGTVVLSGSLPAGTPVTFYQQLLERTPGRAILDVRGHELLEALALRPFLVKPNREELARTVGRSLATDEEQLAAMRELNRRGAEWVVISRGKQSLWATTGNAAYRIEPPATPVVNPIGCGDCLAAGIATALDKGRNPIDAIAFGVAAAADNLSQLLPARLNRQRVEQRAATISVDRL